MCCRMSVGGGSGTGTPTSQSPPTGGIVIPKIDFDDVKGEFSVLHERLNGISPSPQQHVLTHYYESKSTSVKVRPERVAVEVVHTGTALIMRWTVNEPFVRAVNTEYDSPVWQDSCVECFLWSSNHPDVYFNFEMNPIGAVLVQVGSNKSDAVVSQRKSLPAHLITQHLRIHTSFPTGKPFQETATSSADKPWTLTAIIPFKLFASASGWHSHAELDEPGFTVRGNFYKCGDGLTTPHYVSLFPIVTDRPNFHRPDSFQPLVFASSPPKSQPITNTITATAPVTSHAK